MRERVDAAGRRFARLATTAVGRRPELWPLFRPVLRRQFDWLAPVWEGRRGPEALAPLEAALAVLPAEPHRILDAGTGTGKAARLAAGRFPDAEIVGVDLSPRMVEEARRRLPAELTARVRFEAADASRLPYEDGAFDLVLLLNMIPFFGELARLTAPDGAVVLAFSSGAETPMYTPPALVRRELGRLGFSSFEELAAGEGTALVARRAA